jgi:hypothetical protein
VIGRDGIALYSKANPDCRRRSDPGDMFAVLEKVVANARADNSKTSMLRFSEGSVSIDKSGFRGDAHTAAVPAKQILDESDEGARFRRRHAS